MKLLRVLVTLAVFGMFFRILYEALTTPGFVREPQDVRTCRKLYAAAVTHTESLIVHATVPKGSFSQCIDIKIPPQDSAE